MIERLMALIDGIQLREETWANECARRRRRHWCLRADLDAMLLQGQVSPDDWRYGLLAWAEFEMWLDAHQPWHILPYVLMGRLSATGESEVDLQC